jgi:mono/diheme cytochrome c family protein
VSYCLLPLAILASLVLASAAPLTAAQREPPAEQVRFFETRIRPLLAEHCYRCHGPDRHKGGLRLDARQGMLRGGDSGTALIVTGRPEQSLLIRAVGHQDDTLRMPPKKRLSDRQVADLTRWVQRGAPYPQAAASAGSEAGQQLWAFRPPADPPVPAVQDGTWARTPLDRFVLARLEASGLKPVPPADRRTLIRRATFDLTGLPPTPQQIDAFVADQAPGAFARLVDRLLASPAYGERWGRHWLDVARYADSNGMDENVAHGNAWRYRDYVIAAFNRDKPYDQFLLEQLAGDLLPATDPAVRRERLIATGFLALGPKVLAEPDEKKMEMDIVDEQIDTVGRSLLGLTLGCARCHDHKFDPIATEDYYALAGIFKSTRTMETYTKVARWHENSVATDEDLRSKAEHDRQIARQKEVIQTCVARADAAQRSRLKGGAKLPKNPEGMYPAETRAELQRLRDELVRLEQAALAMPSAMGVTEGTVADAAVHLRGSHLKLGKVVARRVPKVLAGPDPPRFEGKQSGRLQLAQWLIRPDHPLTSRVMVNRIWRWHFGQGLVRSPDNFGRLGEPPANPALLDWLAHRFVAGGWSVKAMHRLIMLSATYQMSSAHEEHDAQRDPENRLHWRMNVRRLEAEAIRDALLAVGGSLDRTMGGSLLGVKNRAYLFDHTSRDATRYDIPRRSLYQPVIRNHLYDVFQLFDSTDATVQNGDRATTTVAPQALFLLNSDLGAQVSERLAAGLLADRKLDDAGRIRRLYLRAYGRPATAEETAKARDLVRTCEQELQGSESDTGKRRARAWACLCQVVVAANEFIYLR